MNHFNSYPAFFTTEAFDTQWIFPRINTWKSLLASIVDTDTIVRGLQSAATSWRWHNNSIFIGFCWCSVGRRLAGAGPGGSIDIEYEAAAAASCPKPGSSQQSVPGGSVTRSTESRVTSALPQPHLSSVQPSVPRSTLSISCVILVLQSSDTDA